MILTTHLQILLHIVVNFLYRDEKSIRIPVSESSYSVTEKEYTFKGNMWELEISNISKDMWKLCSSNI
jgi:hypothetical protein